MTTEALPSLAPKTFAEMMQFCETIATSSFCPKDYKGKPGEIIVAIQYGAEIGLKPMQALQNIAVINGRPCVWGDSLLALVQASGLLDYIEETDDGKTATCVVKRKGYPNPHTVVFSMEDAQRAGLTGKQGPWAQYPKRMRQMRARSFALRNQFADAIGGLIAREEAIDITPLPAEQPVEHRVDVGQLAEEETPRAKPLELVQDEDVATSPEASSADQGGQPVSSPAGGEALTADEKALARDLLAKAPGTLTAKLAKIRKVLPNFSGVDNLKDASELDAFAKALQ